MDKQMLKQKTYSSEDLGLLASIVEKAAKTAVEETIPTVVNGKIDAISRKLDSHILEHKDQAQTFKVHMDLEQERYELMKPVLESFTQWSGFKKKAALFGVPTAMVITTAAGIFDIWRMSTGNK